MTKFIWCDGVSTGSGSDRVTKLAMSILGIRCDPVATAPGTDLIKVGTLTPPAKVTNCACVSGFDWPWQVRHDMQEIIPKLSKFRGSSPTVREGSVCSKG